MKAGLVADLTPFYKAWGIRVEDFAPGGVGRFTLEDGPKQGVFGVGDFLAGNVVIFNKGLFDQAAPTIRPWNGRWSGPSTPSSAARWRSPARTHQERSTAVGARLGFRHLREVGSSAPTAGGRPAT